MPDTPELTHDHHSPPHLFDPGSVYIVTAGTHRRQRLFNTDHKLDFLLRTLFEQADRLQWRLKAWAVMPNHYHFVARAPQDAESLSRLIRSVHAITSRGINRIDGQEGRRVWYRYWDTCITSETSYLARLNYVHSNPARHGLVGDATNYQWCSMRWFLSGAEDSFQRTVLNFPCSRISIVDDF